MKDLWWWKRSWNFCVCINAILQMLSIEFVLLYKWKASNEISQVEFFHVSAQNLMLLTLTFKVCLMVFTFFVLEYEKKCVVHPPIFKSLNLDFYSTTFIEVKIICEHIFRRLWWKGRRKCNSVFRWLDTKIYMEKKNLDSYRPSVFFILYIWL